MLKRTAMESRWKINRTFAIFFAFMLKSKTNLINSDIINTKTQTTVQTMNIILIIIIIGLKRT